MLGVLLALAPQVDAQPRRHRRPRAEVVAWTSDGSLVVFAEPQRRSRRTVDLVARRVPDGEVVARRRIYPGPCAHLIDRSVAVAHACALARLRPELPSGFQRRQFHVAASERNRIQSLSLRADGSVVERQLPGLGLVLRGRIEQEREDERVAILEVAEQGQGEGGSVIDRRPVRPRARRHWVLLQAGDDHVIVVGLGVLRRIDRARPREPDEERPARPQSDLASGRLTSG
jgi:hypothetical protein